MALASAPLAVRAQSGPPADAAPAIALRADGTLTVAAPAGTRTQSTLVPLTQNRDWRYLHPTARGYALWAEAMAPTLERLLK